MPKQRVLRRSKRRFSGNQFTRSKNNAAANEKNDHEEPRGAKTLKSTRRSVSSKKLKIDEPKLSTPIEDELADVTITGYRLCDMEILSSAFSSLRCGECGDFSIILMENRLNRKGCASFLRLLCEKCGWKHEFYSSQKQTKSFEVNRRLIYSLRSLGKGHSGAKKFCALMNMPPPPTARAFAKNSKTVAKHVKKIAKESMVNAAKEIRDSKGAAENDVIDCAVSCDGTWQKRGYSSKNGCITIISMDTGKVLDTEALAQSCKQCQRKSNLNKESEEYRLWWAEHNYKCKANHKGTAPAIETEGADRIFSRSLENYKLRYSELYGDGDSKSYEQVKNTYLADGVEVEKKECIGHVQKRLGTALRKLKKDQSGIGGKGKLTDAMIDKMQNYYGIAIRSNVDNLDGMTKAIHATLFHCASNEKRPIHDHCPAGPSSWCGYQRDQANKTKKFKHGPGLPLDIIGMLKPIYQRLSNNELLKKCLHGKTQNQNESFNAMIWQRIPKEVYVGRELLEFGLYDAVSNFNMGAKAALLLYQELNIPCGKYTEEGCRLLDIHRIKGAEYKESDQHKKQRKILRGQKKKKDDKKQQKEGVTYAAGAF